MSSLPEESDIDQKLIDTIEQISTHQLRLMSHSRYVDELAGLIKDALRHDAMNLIVLIDSIKCCKTACYKRDILLEVLQKTITDDSILTTYILCKPFKDLNRQNSWKELSNAIVSIPDLVANCQADDKVPHLCKSPFYEYILDKLYDAIITLANDRHDTTRNHLMFFAQILGRTALSDRKSLVWHKFTSRYIDEQEPKVTSMLARVFRLPLAQDEIYGQFDIFIERLYLPIFSNLKPTRSSRYQLRSILSYSILHNDHFQYLICDKSLFKINYGLGVQAQAVILFNISAYLSSLVDHHVDVTLTHVDGSEVGKATSSDSDGKDSSLLIRTLLEVVRNWTSVTKVLLRTYEHSRYVTAALIILFRFALEYERESLTKHACQMQSSFANVIPTYLNRASPEHSNLAICLGKLLFPKLAELMINRCDESNQKASTVFDELVTSQNLSVDYPNELVFLQRYFHASVDELFQDFSTKVEIISLTPQQLSKSATQDARSASNKSLGGDSAGGGGVNRRRTLREVSCDGNSTGAAYREQLHSDVKKNAILRGSQLIIELDDFSASSSDACSELVGAGGMKRDADGNNPNKLESEEDDLEPYAIDDDEDDEADELNDADCSQVPIYLRDCIEGLVENNNRRYVRLCLMKAGELIDQLIEMGAETNEKQMASLADQRYGDVDRLRGERDILAARAMGCSSSHSGQTSLDRLSRINDTIRDVGVEMARTLLFMDNQFNIEGFRDYRINSLISLCCAAPQLVAKYLIEEFNGTNRSMQQQLDVLQVLVGSAERLSSHGRRTRAGTLPSSLREESSVVLGGHRKQSAAEEESSKTTTAASALNKAAAVAKKQINIFSHYAPMYFYGVVYRLKADFVDNKSLIISQPASIVSAFRALKCEPIEDGDGGEQILAAPSTRGKGTVPPIISTTPFLVSATHLTTAAAAAATTTTTTTPSSSSSTSSTTTIRTAFSQQLKSTTTSATSRKDADGIDNEIFNSIDKFLERNSLSDDSHLLSKILLSTALMIQCASQQPIVCQLSADLVDILAAYRAHPDPGVQRSMVFCLKTIRACTPQVYYENCIERRLVYLFGAWLANNESNIASSIGPDSLGVLY